jgi:uncharacterized peroxidase-related enzyme
MSRISKVGRAGSTGPIREAFDRKIAERGNIPNMYRVFAHRPELLTTMDEHFNAVLGSGTVPLKLKEMLALQTSQCNGSRYCSASHTILAEKTGSTKDQIARLRDFENGPFTDREKAALRFGLQMTQEPTRVPDETFDELRHYFTEGEIVEIAAVVGLFNYFNRFNEALRMEPTKPGEGVDS